MQQDVRKDVVNLFDRYAKSGNNADLKAWAAKTLPGPSRPFEDGAGIKVG